MAGPLGSRIATGWDEILAKRGLLQAIERDGKRHMEELRAEQVYCPQCATRAPYHKMDCTDPSRNK